MGCTVYSVGCMVQRVGCRRQGQGSVLRFRLSHRRVHDPPFAVAQPLSASWRSLVAGTASGKPVVTSVTAAALTALRGLAAPNERGDLATPESNTWVRMALTPESYTGVRMVSQRHTEVRMASQRHARVSMASQRCGHTVESGGC